MDKIQSVHLDADESVFFARQLEHIKAKTYDILYPELKARSLIPVSREAGRGAKHITYRQYDQTGFAKIVASYSDDLPRADVKGKEFIANVKRLGASYGYNVDEIRSAQFAGVSLEQRKANAARRAVSQLENDLVWFGDVASGIVGLINHPNIGSYTIPNDGTGPSKLWANKTPDQIIRDLNGVANKAMADTLGIHAADTLLLPIAKYTYIASTPRSANSDTTILQYFLQNNPFIKSVEWVNELQGAGTGGVDVMIAYKKSPDVLTMEVVEDFEQLPVQERNLEFVVNCGERFGGTLVFYPLAITKAEEF